MFKLVLLLCAAAAFARPMTHMSISKEHLPHHTAERVKQIMDEVNTKDATWKAGHNSRFADASLKFIKSQLGAKPNKGILPVTDIPTAQAIPDSFDSRTQWGSICPSTSEIRDQSACGSCWAFGAAEAITDRICIASKGAKAPHISAEDLNSCCFTCGSGCDGGYPEEAWLYWKSSGIVTGGNYNSNQGCMPYVLPNCDHHVTGKYQPCGNTVPTPACTRRCEASYNKTYTADKIKGSSAYSVPATKIQTEIMTNGPVEGAFTVFEDFLAYKSGVYEHKTGQELGGHAIKILGWGVDSGVNYWIVANSWNTDWGNQGYFNIKRGTDECGIESGVVAGLP